ncbi:glycosyltransferase family 2 protein [Pseudoalteromonas luteoviolacea]|uniref:Glycosyltransferase 2-like domain-containing protein n=1 Tax=Pseudoalteromonas luteoviolacea S4054 TaxID=1129367 RepID=A0A0F6AF27_9GAMM|nr:glycosyltransferase family 2 protein [Pseudoalteromonas luteoviolacea]AOT09716.1 hypothetical protein S4054249_18640 [Pseudoalteromonas luteoviolacea]AOT14629.1 hypothetical protein S40542_18610 [Pseudoalteromonas luteoviolacea]AOT19543.1 hypothetical protein S4054_18615 [Pseudoalteromonas luteoviolacea]KKE83984.1 hypothetical protein N479_11265 [Pseudoalteromonas luteoviolacea S4054]KZN77378.1 hypothetical protein N481_04805 [Pseudoalteromonas luteoviolacea S4047-1]
MFSVIMPAYNAERFLETAILSVIAQSYSHWELLVVDDGSSDKTKELVEQYAKQDSRIKLLNNEFKKGAAGARNTGITHAKYKYITFLDSDDFWKEGKLENQLAAFDQSGHKLLYSNYHVVSEGASLDNFMIKNTFHAPDQLSFEDLLRTCSIGCLTAAYDAEYFGKVLFPNSPKEDYALWLCLLKKCTVASNTGHVDAFYRQTPGSLSSNKIQEFSRQAYVLKHYGNIGGIKLALNLISYAYHGFTKYRK